MTHSPNRHRPEVLEYGLDEPDHAFVAHIHRVLLAAFQLPRTSWAKRASIASLLHVLERMPRPSSVGHVRVEFVGPKVSYGEVRIYFHFTVEIEDEVLRCQLGGHFYRPSTGGDSFTVFFWQAAPGGYAELSDFRSSLGVVAQYVEPLGVLNDMPKEISRYALSIEDQANPMLDDEAADLAEEDEEDQEETDDQTDETEDTPGTDDNESAEEDEDIGGPVTISAVTQADTELLNRLGAAYLNGRNLGSAYGIEACDACDVELSTVGLFVDGNSPRSGWGNYCAACCLAHGVGLGRGQGQLYARQPDGSWKGIAGF